MVAIPVSNKSAIITVAAYNSPFRSRADYVCDGTDDGVDISAAVEKIKDIGGTVRLMGGTFVLHSANVLFRQGVHICGEGIGATKIQLGTGHEFESGDGLFEIDAVDNYDGGTVRGISFEGDGGTAVSGRADLSATVDGINATLGGTARKLYNFHVENCSFKFCRRAWNGEGARERFVLFKGNEIWLNNYGIWMGEHINVSENDIRFNDVGIYGQPFDANFNSVRVCYNRIGISGNAGGENSGITNCFLQGGAIFANTEDGLVLRGTTCLAGVHFGISTSDTNSSLVIAGSENNVNGCYFLSQSASNGATQGAIRFDTGTYGNNIIGCSFYNPKGPCIKLNTTQSTYGMRLEHCNIRLITHGILNETAGGGPCRQSSISYNYIRPTTTISVPVIEQQKIGSTVAGNKFNGNTFEFTTGRLAPCVFKGTLDNSQFCNNDLRTAVYYSVPVLDESTVVTDAIIRDNNGWGAQGMVVVVHGATATTARPPWPGVVQWFGSVRPINAIANDIWVDTY